MPEHSALQPPEPTGLREAVVGYEARSMANDLDALDRFFATGEATLRGDAAGLSSVTTRSRAYRRARGGAPARTIVDTHIRAIDDGSRARRDDRRPGDAADSASRRSCGGGIPWRAGSIDAAHVSAPAPRVDSSIWRTVGTPLVAGAASGPLARATGGGEGPVRGGGSPGGRRACPPTSPSSARGGGRRPR